MSDWIRIVDDKYQTQLFGWPLVDVVAIFTVIGLIVGWIFASMAKKETARANMLNALPIINLTYNGQDREDKVCVQNLGNGAATQIKIDPYYLPIYDDVVTKKAKLLKLRFKTVPLLLTQEIKHVPVDGEAHGMFDIKLQQFTMRYARIPLIFTVRYRDITGAKYITRIKIHDGNTEIVTPPRRYTLKEVLIHWLRRFAELLKVNTVSRYQLHRMAKENKSDQHD